MPQPSRAPKPTAPTALPDLIALAAAAYDRSRSTPWHERYTVASATNIGVRYTAIYDVAARTWTCNGEWCGRAKWCRHRQLAATLKECLWWERQLADCTPAELRALIPGKACQVRCDVDALSAHAAILVIDALLMAADDALDAA